MTNNIFTSALDEQFKNDCKVINLKYEYPGYTGTEPWAIITDLSENELITRYSEQIAPYKPFIILSASYGKARDEYRRNEKKHEMRAIRSIEPFNYDDDLINEASALKKKVQHGIRENKDLWGSKLQCSCGHSFRKNRWHKNKGMPWSYGYQCYNQLNNGSANQRRKAGVDDTGFCDQSMIADWKLEMMAKLIFEHIWKDRKEAIDTVCNLIKECYQLEMPKKVNLTGIVSQIERYKNKKSNLLEMRTDGEISKEEYKEQREKIDKALADLNEEYERMLATEKTIKTPDICWDKIRCSLEEMIDFSQPQIDRILIGVEGLGNVVFHGIQLGFCADVQAFGID